MTAVLEGVPCRARRPEERVEQREAFARTFAVHVGVDSGKTFHKLVAAGRDGVRTRAEKVMVSRAAFEDAVAFLQQTFPGVALAEMLVGIEFAGHHGSTFAAYLRARGLTVVAVPAMVTKRLKEVEDNSPRKDDAKDAAQICKLLRSGYFVTGALPSPLVAELRVLATERHRLAVEETRLKNRLHATLDTVWTEFHTHFSSLGDKTPRALLRRWPVAADLAAARPVQVHALMKRMSQNHFAPAKARAVIASAKASISLTTGLDARRMEVRRLLDRWDLLTAQMAAIEEGLTARVAQHPGAQALMTIPEVGVVCAATLVAELGAPESYESPRQVLKLAGMNLAGRESGTSMRGRIKQTKRGRPLLRRQLYLLAGRWCKPKGLYHAPYLALAGRNGGSKISAICAMARRLVPLVLHVMQTAEPFDLARWRREHHAVAA